MENDDALATIARRHGVDAERVTPLPGGVANRAYLLGDELVLRIARRSPAFAADLRKEAAVIPVARAAGVRTPAIVEFDDSGALLDAPYMVLERVHGIDMAQVDLPRRHRAGALRQLGRELGRLHRRARATPDELPEVPIDNGGGHPRDQVARMVTNGFIDVETGRWLAGWFDRLAERLPEHRARVLLHGDVAPQNILVEPETGELRALVDWGDASWSDPAMEFAKLSLSDVSLALEGYREEAGDGAWEAGALWYHLSWGLARLEHPAPRPGERHWTAPPASRVLGIMRFLAGSPPEPWQALSRDAGY